MQRNCIFSKIILALCASFFTISCDEKPTEAVIELPVVSTLEISAIRDSSAQCEGVLVSEGGAPVTEYGICWRKNLMPSVEHDRTIIQSQNADSFKSQITGLLPNKVYKVRAYATNSAGTSYGKYKEFKTKPLPTGLLTDIDGNTYITVKIGEQWWTAENLRVTHYRNGDAIPNVVENSEWRNLTTGAYCAYNNDENIADIYGYLYNWYVIKDQRQIAPEGWHVSSDGDWLKLEEQMGMVGEYFGWKSASPNFDQGGRLKEAGTLHWSGENTGATDEIGFCALPSGFREDKYGSFKWFGNFAYFGTRTYNSNNEYFMRALAFNSTEIFRNSLNVKTGLSIRLVKD